MRCDLCDSHVWIEVPTGSYCKEHANWLFYDEARSVVLEFLDSAAWECRSAFGLIDLSPDPDINFIPIVETEQWVQAMTRASKQIEELSKKYKDVSKVVPLLMWDENQAKFPVKRVK